MHTLINLACPKANQTLRRHRNQPLILKRDATHQLARFMPPSHGWTRWDLYQVGQRIPAHWFEQPFEVYLGDTLLHQYIPNLEVT